MKEKLKLLLYVFALFLFSDCKKQVKTGDTIKPIQKTLSDSIVKRAWWGQFTYTKSVPEYYIIHFNADSTFLFSQLSGDYPGTYSLNSNIITMRPDANNVIITATFKEDQFITITDNTSIYEFNNGKLVPFPATKLPNSSWSGTTNTDPFSNNIFSDSVSLNLNFKSTEAMMLFGVSTSFSSVTNKSPFAPNIYGDSFRFTFLGPKLTMVNIFGVKVNDKLIRGDIRSIITTRFHLTKRLSN